PLWSLIGADERLARADADPNAEAAARAFLTLPCDQVPYGESGANCPLGMVLLRHRRAKHRQDCIADRLLDASAEELELFRDPDEAWLEDPLRLFRVERVSGVVVEPGHLGKERAQE